ncbi:MAG: hypothetical protein WAS73_14540 [Defluviicoccus sp.]
MSDWINQLAWNDLHRRLTVLENGHAPQADAVKLTDTLGWVRLAAEEQMPFAGAVAIERLLGLLASAFGWPIDFSLGAPSAGKTAEQFLAELNQAQNVDQPA